MTSNASPSDPHSAFRQAQMEHLVGTTPAAWLLSSLGAVICYVQYGGRESPSLFAWLVGFLAVSALRFVAALYATHLNRSVLRNPQWTRRWLVSTYVHATQWGLLAIVLHQPGSAEAEAILHTTLAAIAMGGCTRLPGFPRMLHAHVLLVLGPLVLRDLLSGSAHLALMAVLVFLIGAYSLISGRNQSQSLMEIERQRRRNAELLEALTREHARSETALRAAEEAGVARTRFFAAANHDLRQPLHAMGLLLNTIPAQSLPPSQRETVERLTHCIDGMSEVVDGLLEIARLDGGQWTPQYSVFDAGSAILESCRPYEAAAQSKGLAFTTHVCQAHVRSDRALFMRVLSNLVANAIRYTPEGSVAIVAKRAGDRLHISIEDTGVGIEAEHLPRIFEEFYQAGNPSRDRRQGLGLGLATVKRLSDLLSLSVAVSSAPRRGSVFSLSLPLASAAAALPSSTSENLSAVSVHRVLVIEDDADSRHALVALLTSWGCVAIAAETVEKGLGVVDRGETPDVAIVDYRLPDGATGVDAIGVLRERFGKDFPAVIVTGDAGMAGELRASGLVVMIKPVRPLQLRAFLSQSFSRPSADAQHASQSHRADVATGS